MGMFDDLIPQQRKTVSFDDLVPQESGQTMPTAVDVAASLGSGIERGIVGLAGLPGDVGSIMRSVAGIEGPRQTGLTPTSQQVVGAYERVRGGLHKPQTTAGEYAQTIGEFAPGAFLPGGMARRAANVVAPGVASEAAGQATEGTPLEPYARIGGAVLGGMAPNMASRAVTPFPARAGTADAARALEAEGIPTTAGQATGNKALKYAESEIGGARTSRLIDEQNEAFTRAASRRIGIDSPHLDGATMQAAYQRIGNQFDAIAARNQLAVDNTLYRAAYNSVGDYMRRTPVTQRVPMVEEYAREILALRGNVGGDIYQSLRSRLGADARAATKPDEQHALYSLQRNLDDAMERSMRRSGNAADVDALREARTQYRNYLALEDAMATGGQETAAGILTPARLEQAAANKFGRRAYLHGSEFSQLAKAGKVAMTKMPESGTGARMAINLIPAAVGGAIGGGGAGAIGAAAGAIGGRAVAGRALMSRPVQGYLRNQLFQPEPGRNLLLRGGMNALLAR